MNASTLTIQLIARDMAHARLIEGICRLGFENHTHPYDTMELVANLMGITATDAWCDTYMQHLQKAANTDTTTNLLPLAEACFKELESTTITSPSPVERG